MEKVKLKTKRLYLMPMPIEELDKKVLLMEDGELRQAYQEMLNGVRRHPELALFYTPWKICLKENNTLIGDLGFKGGPIHGAVEIGYGLEEPYFGNGYMTEAVAAAVEWAFTQKGIYAVTAETLPENLFSQRVLEKNGFVPDGEGEEGPRFRKEKPVPSYVSLGLSLGMCFGCSIGVLTNLSMGLSLGLAGGVLIGTLLDKEEKKKREECQMH